MIRTMAECWQLLRARPQLTPFRLRRPPKLRGN